VTAKMKDTTGVLKNDNSTKTISDVAEKIANREENVLIHQ
jgi:hypothetical protein